LTAAVLLGNAQVLLVLIDWPEPFGVVMIEAMTCGTPVIATPRGRCLRYRLRVTEYIVADIEEAIAAVDRVSKIDRACMRARFEQRFTADPMTRDYLDVCAALPA
jgi:glycosyltransferase involved in cell wall biosynthesis